jgi:hypothetical protein
VEEAFVTIFIAVGRVGIVEKYNTGIEIVKARRDS